MNPLLPHIHTPLRVLETITTMYLSIVSPLLYDGLSRLRSASDVHSATSVNARFPG